MPNWALGSVIVNIVLAMVILVLVLSWSGARFGAPWDGPSIATLVLTAATLMLGGVAVIAGLLAVWGFATLREHAGNIAKQAATDVADKVAGKRVEELVKEWTLTSPAPSEGVADTYKDTGNV